MRNYLVTLITLAILTPYCFGVEGYYVGVRTGSVDFSTSANPGSDSTIGYGLDFGLRMNKDMDLIGTIQGVPRADSSLISQTLSAEFRPLDLDSMNVTVGIGPAVYFGGQPGASMRLGANAGAAAALILKDSIHVGCSSRYHVLGGSGEGSSFWSFMAQVGYLFGKI